MKHKKRYSVPAKLVELLFIDDAFFNEVSKIKKASTDRRFPKTDQWASDSGFNMKFALAGYSIEDVMIVTSKNTIQIKSDGLDEEKYVPPVLAEDDDAYKAYSKGVNTKIYTGYVSRGIARRSFELKYIISEEFDVSSTEAYMQDGLLHIFVPNSSSKELNELRPVKISSERKY